MTDQEIYNCKTYMAEIKEKGNPSILTPQSYGHSYSKQDLIKFWGLDQPDIEWFKLYCQSDESADWIEI